MHFSLHSWVTTEVYFTCTAEKTQADPAQLNALLLYGFLCSTVVYLDCGILKSECATDLKITAVSLTLLDDLK